MSQELKPGDMILIGVIVPEGYDGVCADLLFQDFCDEPHGWDKTLEGVKKKEAQP